MKTEYTDLGTLSRKLAELADNRRELEELARLTEYIPEELKKNLLYFRHLVERGSIPAKDKWEH